jgi:hypothetical protein
MMRVESLLLRSSVNIVAISILLGAALSVLVALCCSRTRRGDEEEEGDGNDDDVLYESSTDDENNKNVRGGVLYDEEGNRREFGASPTNASTLVFMLNV